ARQGRGRLPVDHEHGHLSAGTGRSDKSKQQQDRIIQDPASIIDFARSAMLVLLEIIAPTMITALVVGLGIGLLQAVTQIQEQTLVFVPKIVASFVVLLLALPFIGAAMSGLMTDIAARIAAYLGGSGDRPV